MEREFEQVGNKKIFWQQGSRILLAVSGGADSFVLLRLMAKMSQKYDFFIGVAHINHQLRPSSTKEAQALAYYCQMHHIAFFERKWEDVPHAGVEEAARRFRYAFFAELMQEYYFDTVMTAHHADDQLETMLMKIIRDGQLKNAMGIKVRQSFAGGKLIRPLLSYSKKEIYDYAKKENLPYFEDESNYYLDVQRNRIRQQITPLLKAENPQILAHFQQLSQQLIWADEIIETKAAAWISKYVKQKEENLSFKVKDFLNLPVRERYFTLQYLAQKIKQSYEVTISEENLQRILKLLTTNKAQWQLDVAAFWQVLKMYEEVIIGKKAIPNEAKTFHFRVGDSGFLSETEWLAIVPAHQNVNLPEKVKLWSEISQPLALNFPNEVIIRKRMDGDRIQLKDSLRKKVSRILIDKKIPNDRREKTWVVTDTNNQVLAVLPITFSYLSIAVETDKIHYRLLYKYQ
ncbi:tRNA(Ile)-lysidine synthase [Enterococcus saigonensis]|uniref:tRNA(Ile)-lysidine synthase n=1 Tax=Enterococcus saigonensis TaxID=1805431 RepID=A0A679I9M8_9ENTE|nr:tRNA lysidine(34) synthetase TilS [Enterococcus saigonensis]BCA84739.1 tRNA(Ile)-lysidine synthase [Enterococcus saigonensis]